MAEEDPFFIVKEEVLKALEKSRNLYQCWKGQQSEDETNGFLNATQDPNWVLTELKNKLRSIDWDLEDLEEAFGIGENRSKEFKLDSKEIANRRAFIKQTREEVKSMKDSIADNKNVKKDTVQAMAALLNPNIAFANSTLTGSGTRYTRLQNELECPNRTVYNQTEISIEESVSQAPHHQDIGSLTSEMVSNRPPAYADEQAVMLDDYTHDLDLRDPKTNCSLKKYAKLFLASDGKKQVTAVGIVLAFFLLSLYLL